ncbi:glycosyltransferase family 2 protein [Kocuria rosea]|uniref:glycosyltransferase family 2 protein n=1 Tax=Kocuria rosea TaxID=1275 RepID=UPI002540BE22|nr:glycosyltransferase family 2 protein [Kocuria rosea]WIG16351.1 glycosyltransferase family 2 protein [Kocuria rosea]
MKDSAEPAGLRAQAPAITSSEAILAGDGWGLHSQAPAISRAKPSVRRPSVSVGALEPLGASLTRSHRNSAGESGGTSTRTGTPPRRLIIILWVVSAVAGLYGLQELLYPNPGFRPRGWWQWGYALLCLVWVVPILPASVAFIGSMWYRHVDNSAVAPIDTLVSWRIVSRGTNVSALRSTIERCQREMAARPLFPHVIEVVVDDKAPDLPRAPNIRYIVVPPDYETPNGSLFKARALQYALDNAALPDDAWIVHLDEETQPTPSGIEGIAQMIREEEAAGTFRIGQGCILYHRDWKRHPILTLADMLRTGDDLSRFYFQHKLGVTLFGLHGSYIVVRNSVSKEVGFDFGPEGSITEDAFWALVQMGNGRRARWCHGYLEEQSTQSLMDFVKQRRRWYLGLLKVVLYAPVPLRWWLPLGITTAFWTLMPIGCLYTFTHFFYGTAVPEPARAIANLAFGIYIMLYVMGLRVNLDEAGERRWWKRQFWYMSMVLLIPLFCVLEAAGIAYGLVKRETGFHVVKK